MVTELRPSLLYITPVIPALTGNGLAMRAGMVLEALCSRFAVSVLVIPLYASMEAAVPEALAALCERCAVSGIGEAPVVFRDREFDVVHVFRLAAVPYARPYLQPPGSRPKRHLDLDDIESKVHARLAELLQANGDDEGAGIERARGKKARMLELALLPFFDRVYVCSEEDRKELACCRTTICVLPNAVRVPPRATRKNPPEKFTFLFLATFGYYPNYDAAIYFCASILPELRQTFAGNFGVDFVGTGISESLATVASNCGVRVVGRVPEVGPWYAQAGALIVPMRAGGGTRIKILEAFSYGCPVVTTSIGMEGLEAVAGEHVLVGDTPQTFASQCARLMTDPEAGAALIERGDALLQTRYTLQAIRRAL